MGQNIGYRMSKYNQLKHFRLISLTLFGGGGPNVRVCVCHVNLIKGISGKI